MSKYYKKEKTKSPYHATTEEDENKKKLLILSFSDSRENENSKRNDNDNDDFNYNYKTFSVNRFTFPKSPEKYTCYSDFKNNFKDVHTNIEKVFFNDENYQNKYSNVFKNKNGNYTEFFFPENKDGKIKKKLYEFLKMNEMKKKENKIKENDKEKIEKFLDENKKIIEEKSENSEKNSKKKKRKSIK